MTIIDVVSAVLITNYSFTAMLALAFWDWVISLPEEIHCFWNLRKGHGLSAAALLYGLARYSAIVKLALVLQTMFPISERVCQVNFYLQGVPDILYSLAPPIFSAIRVFVLLSKYRVVAATATFLLLFVPGVITMAVNIQAKTIVLSSPFNCTTLSAPISIALGNSLMIVSRACCFVADLFVLLVTWHKTYIWYKAQRGLLKGPSLHYVMLYNGSIYFMIITGINIINIVLFLVPSSVSESSGANFADIATDPITSILTCHFLINLHQAGQTATTTLSTPSALPSLNFAPSFEVQSGCRSLPALIASIGSDVHIGMDFMDSLATEENDLVEDLPKENGDTKMEMDMEVLNC